MKNFENLKKALAVSVCSSILFSGAPKTSGKEESGAPKTSGKEKSLEDLKKKNRPLVKLTYSIALFSGAHKTSGKGKSLEDLNDDWNNLKVGNNKFRGIIIKK